MVRYTKLTAFLYYRGTQHNPLEQRVGSLRAFTTLTSVDSRDNL